MKKALGILLIILAIVGGFVFMVLDSNFKIACLTFGTVLIIVAFSCLLSWLFMD